MRTFFHRVVLALLVFALLVPALLATSCGRSVAGDDPEPPASEDRIISNVWATSNERRLDVGWFSGTCESFDSIEKTEDDEKVELRLRAFVDSDNCNEPGTVVQSVTLNQPLGDRLVYDVNPFVKNTVLVEAPR